MSRTAWKFVDPVSLVEYPLPVNPYQDGGVTYNKSFNYSTTAATRQNALGDDVVSPLVYQSSVDVRTPNYTGYIYDQEQYNNFLTWVNKDYPIELYDDLLRGWLVRISSFTLDRVRSNANPYKHRYTLTFLILNDL